MASGRKTSDEAKEKAEEGSDEDLGTLGLLNAYNQLIIATEVRPIDPVNLDALTQS